MDPNDTPSKAEMAAAALADLFDEELRAMGAAGRVPESSGRGYEAPHRASAVGMAAEIRYAADVDGGMVVIKG